MIRISWKQAGNIHTKDFKCGYCGAQVASEKGFEGTDGNTRAARIYICHKCNRPTFFDYDLEQYPGPLIGSPVKHIPDPDIEKLFNEAKSCYSISALLHLLCVAENYL